MHLLDKISSTKSCFQQETQKRLDLPCEVIPSFCCITFQSFLLANVFFLCFNIACPNCLYSDHMTHKCSFHVYSQWTSHHLISRQGVPTRSRGIHIECDSCMMHIRVSFFQSNRITRSCEPNILISTHYRSDVTQIYHQRKMFRRLEKIDEDSNQISIHSDRVQNQAILVSLDYRPSHIHLFVDQMLQISFECLQNVFFIRCSFLNRPPF